MSNGTFTPGERKPLPGVYINYESGIQPRPSIQQVGTVVMSLPNINYGPKAQFLRVQNASPDALFSQLGRHITDVEMRDVFLALVEARDVYVFIPNSGTKSTVTVGNLTATAKHPGSRGNDFRIVIADNPTSGSDITVTLDTETVFSQESVDSIEDLNTNDFIDFTGAGAFTSTAGTSLAGGISAAVTNSEVIAFLDEAERINFDCMMFQYTDGTLKTAFNTKMRYFTETIGKLVQGVSVGNAADNRFIYDVTMGFIFNSVNLTNAQALGWFAGAVASAGITSLTNKRVTVAEGLETPPSRSELEAQVLAGQLSLHLVGTEVRIVRDAVSLTTIGANMDESWQQGRHTRTVISLDRSFTQTLVANTLDGNADGYSIAEQRILSVLEAHEALNAIQDVSAADIITDRVSSTGDEYHARVAYRYVGAIEKYFLQVRNI